MFRDRCQTEESKGLISSPEAGKVRQSTGGENRHRFPLDRQGRELAYLNITKSGTDHVGAKLLKEPYCLAAIDPTEL